MPRTYIKKNIRTLWPKDILEAAVKEVKENNMSVNAAARHFKIPRRTLRGHLNKDQVLSETLGKKSTLSSELENELCQNVLKLADVGYPLTSKLIRSSVFTFCVANNIKHNFNKEKKLAGPDWLKSFLSRHPQIAKRKSHALNPSRAAKLNHTVINDYFHKLEEVMIELNVLDKPQCIYNVDEKEYRLCLHKQPYVYAQKGVRNTDIVGQEHEESVTIVSCGNAMGHTIPPMILFKDKKLKLEWQDNLPPGCDTVIAPKGSMTCEILIHWLDHLAKYKSEGNCLLIFDGTKYHLDYRIVNAAEKHQITLFCLPSQTTQELQPMGKPIFGLFDSYWEQGVLDFMRQNPGKEITKQRFGSIFSNVWDKVTTPANVIVGFRDTGIFPFRPYIIQNHVFAPSTVTEMELPEEPSCSNELSLQQWIRDSYK